MERNLYECKVFVFFLINNFFFKYLTIVLIIFEKNYCLMIFMKKYLSIFECKKLLIKKKTNIDHNYFIYIFIHKDFQICGLN